MPAAAFASRRPDSIYQKLVRITSRSLSSFSVASNFSKSKSSKYGLNATSRSETIEKNPEPDVLKSTDRKYRRYFSLDDFSDATLQNNTTNTTTTIQAEEGETIGGLGIRRQLDFDIESNE
jgi:hypothetical protein